jgi:uncharacterized protein (DUF4415 family)
MKKEKTNIDDETPTEIDFSSGERGRYRGRIKPGDTDPRNVKVRVNIYLDGDIIEYFKQMAGQRGADKYLTQINKVLREYIEGGRQDALVSDSAFIDAVAQRVQERLSR